MQFGSLTANGWQLTAVVNAQTGEIGIDLFSTSGDPDDGERKPGEDHDARARHGPSWFDGFDAAKSGKSDRATRVYDDGVG